MEKRRKVRTGKVVSDKMDKTVVVLVETLRRHPLYKKVIRHTSKFKAHDEANACKVGDTVKIVETRPLSKEKCWRVAEIIRRKEVAEVELIEPAQIRPEVEDSDSTSD
jgi:small subunit ribosomal protein S17